MQITIGSVIEESQKEDYFHKKPCAIARDILVLKWAMIGFLLTISYKSVLLSNMINIEYERGFDTVEDVLRSEKTLWIDGGSGIVNLMKTDPREKIKELAKKTRTYETEYRVRKQSIAPLWLSEG